MKSALQCFQYASNLLSPFNSAAAAHQGSLNLKWTHYPWHRCLSLFYCVWGCSLCWFWVMLIILLLTVVYMKLKPFFTLLPPPPPHPHPFFGPALKLFPQLYLFNAVTRPCSVVPFVPVLIKHFKNELLLYCRL